MDKLVWLDLLATTRPQAKVLCACVHARKQVGVGGLAGLSAGERGAAVGEGRGTSAGDADVGGWDVCVGRGVGGGGGGGVLLSTVERIAGGMGGPTADVFGSGGDAPGSDADAAGPGAVLDGPGADVDAVISLQLGGRRVSAVANLPARQPGEQCERGRGAAR